MKTALKTKTAKTKDYGIDSGIIDISPEIARGFLDGNKKNRKLVEKTVNSYARQMEKGQWKLNGEAITIDIEGNLVNGQHRLEAVVKSGVTVPMMVITGVSQESIKTIDSGRPRTYADHLRVHGYNDLDLNTAAAAVRIIFAFDADNKYLGAKNMAPTPTEVINFLDKDKRVFHSLERVPQKSSPLLPRSVAVALHYKFSQVNPVKTEEFFAQLISGANLGSKNPVLALRSRLITMQQESKSGNLKRRMYVSHTIKAFKAFCEGREVSNLLFNPEHDIVL